MKILLINHRSKLPVDYGIAGNGTGADDEWVEMHLNPFHSIEICK